LSLNETQKLALSYLTASQSNNHSMNVDNLPPQFFLTTGVGIASPGLHQQHVICIFDWFYETKLTA
jgi:hypothetical protein